MAQIFQYGIRWDPREPLPPELCDDLDTLPAPNLSDKHVSKASAMHVRTPAVSVNPPANPLPRSGLLAPVVVSVRGQVVSDLALVTVQQTFENETNESIPEARYTFPLPDNCAVTGFNCRVGTAKVLQAKVKPKDEAKQAFKAAVEDGRFAGLLEEHTVEVFTASLGKIPAKTRIKTEISYTLTLSTVFSADETVQTFLVPTEIGPRYGPAPTMDVGHIKRPDRFSLELDVFDAQDTRIRSHTHKIEVEIHDQGEQAQSLEDLRGDCQASDSNTHRNGYAKNRVAHVRMRAGAIFHDSDLQIEIHRKSTLRSSKPSAWLEKHPSLENQYAMMFELPPAKLDAPTPEPTPAGELIFLADRSGSMQDKMESVRLALRFFLKGIPIGWKFNIWSFGTSYCSMWPQSRAYDSTTLAKALSYLDNDFDSNMGGTELLSALQAIVSSTKPAMTTTNARCEVVIITDGAVWRLQETLDAVDHARRASSYKMRFFALGIGRHVSAALVNGIARCGGGCSEIIPEASDGKIWQGRAVTMLKTALSPPSRHKVILQLPEGCLLQAQSPQDHTITNSSLTSHRGFCLFTTAQPGNAIETLKIRLQALDTNGQDHHITISAAPSPTEPGTLHALAARTYLTDYKTLDGDEIPLYFDTINPPRGTMTPQALACRFSLLSRWTSLFLEATVPAQPPSVLDVAKRGHTDETIHGIAADSLSGGICMLYKPRGTRGNHGYSYTSLQRRLALGVSTDTLANRRLKTKLADTRDYELMKCLREPSPQSDSTMRPVEICRRRERRSSMDRHPPWVNPLASRTKRRSNEIDGSNSIATRPVPSDFQAGDEEDSDAGGVVSKMYSPVTRPTIVSEPPPTGKYCRRPPLSVDRLNRHSSHARTPAPVSKKDKVATKHSVVTRIMDFQNYDGSFSSGVEAHIGQGTARAISVLQHVILTTCLTEFRPIGTSPTSPWAQKLARTVVTLAVLARDFSEFAELWALIDTKGRGYVKSVAEGAGLLADALFVIAGAELGVKKKSAKNVDVKGDADAGTASARSKNASSGGNPEVAQADWVELDEAPY